MTAHRSTTTATRQQVQATGLVYFKAVVDHAIEHGLPAPASIDLTDSAVKVWLVEGKEEWADTITVVGDLDVRQSPMPDRVIVYVTGRLPFMNIPVVLAFSQEQAFAPALRVVGA